MEGLERHKEVESVLNVATLPSKGVSSRKRKREVEQLSSTSADAVSEKNLRETAPMISARWKTAAYKGSSEPKKADRGVERDGGLDESGNGRRLQTSEGEHEKWSDEWTNLGGGRWQRMDLERAPGYWETSGQRFY